MYFFTSRSMDNIKGRNMLKTRKIVAVFFTKYNVVACLFAVQSTLFSVACFKIHSVGARMFGTGMNGEA